MSKYIKSNLLCIGGLEFRFPDRISWPTEGPLSCYHSFLTRPSDSATSDNVINVNFKTGQPSLDGERSGVMDSGDGMMWYRSGDVHIVEKVLPHVSPDPLWIIVMHMQDRAADIYFSETYLETAEMSDGYVVAALSYPIDQLLAIHFLALRRRALVHSAGIGYKGKGFMCSGVSGAGKTTTSRLLIEDGRFDVLTDDRVILSCPEDGVKMHGTPWTGEGEYATAGVASLSAMFFLKKSQDIRAERLAVRDTVARLMPVTSVPWFDEELMTPMLKTLEDIAEKVPAYDLHFTPSADTPEFIAEMLDSE